MYHIGIIPDGNRRYAKKRHLNLLSCYEKSAKKALKIVDWLEAEGADEVTFYVFSIENKDRPKEELFILSDLFLGFFAEILNSNTTAKVRIIGDLELIYRIFGDDVGELACRVMKQTENNQGIKINLLMCYGGRQMPYINLRPFDCIIRTANEKRLSNFPPIQSAGALFYSVRKKFPQFTLVDLCKVIKRFKRDINV